ncbi:MAG TPA: hypothetical protein VFZ53_13880, partial [Polyangiaceae bacterium]
MKRFVVLGLVAALFSACGDGDEQDDGGCTPGAVRCLSDKSGIVCSEEGSESLPFDCDDGQVCGTDENGEDGCIGGCDPGATECASQAISRVCTDDGKTWIPVACAPGTGCDGDPETDSGEPNPTYGTCVRSDDPSVTVCRPRQTVCADGSTVKTCENDGSNWVYAPCATNEACDDGECVVDPAKGCTPNTGVCVDATHVKKCAEDGKSYAPVETCPGTSTCSDGSCRGPVCTVGEIRCDDVRDGNVFSALARETYQPRALYTCVDGERWETEACPRATVCAYTDISATAVNRFVEDLKSALANDASPPLFVVPESSRASCQTPACAAPFALRELLGAGYYEGLFFGSYACGDPTTEDASDVGSFSLCEGLPPYNNLHWANYACPRHTECAYEEDPSQPDGSARAPVCQGACNDGDVRCYDALGEATITCHDGSWDPATITRCADGARERWCRRNLDAGGTNFTQASCQDPACVVWQEEFETFAIPPGYGACGDDGLFYACRHDGTLIADEPCPSCVRSSTPAPDISPPSRDPSHFAGYQPGYCLAECAEGEERCVDIGSATPSPFYYQCEAGQWATIASCASGQPCNDYPSDPRLPDAPRRILCGAVECFPDQTRCVGADGEPGGERLATCNARGAWGPPVLCDRGTCTEDDQQASGTAACEDECIPRSKTCVDATNQATCGNDARYGAPETCLTRTACIAESAALARLGCVECVPRDPADPERVPDSRCDADELEVCGLDGRWATA